jgi:hypothetical protein
MHLESVWLSITSYAHFVVRYNSVPDAIPGVEDLVVPHCIFPSSGQLCIVYDVIVISASSRSMY